MQRGSNRMLPTSFTLQSLCSSSFFVLFHTGWMLLLRVVCGGGSRGCSLCWRAEDSGLERVGYWSEKDFSLMAEDLNIMIPDL